MRNTLTALVVGLALGVSAPASAASTSVWDFTGGGGLSNPTSFDDGNGNIVNAYAFTQIDVVPNVFYGTDGVTLTQTSGGLGAHNDLEVLFGFIPIDSGSVDNTILRDILVFEFDSPAWSPVSINFTGVDFNDGATVYGWNGSLDLDFGIDDSNILFNASLPGLPDGTATLGFSLSETFKYLAVAGPEGFGDELFDNFRVAGLEGTVVPVPPALILMVTGLVGLGLFGRRRVKTSA